MKKLLNLKHVILICSASIFIISCSNREPSRAGEEVTDIEQRERDKVGDVYNSRVQGIDIENRDNQFFQSRNDNWEGTGMETGAPSDTIDNDGDVKISNIKQEEQ